MIGNDEAILKLKSKHRLPMAVLGGDLSVDEQTLYAACMNGLFQVELNTGTVEKLDSHESYVSSVCTLDENIIASSGYDGAIQWFDVRERARRKRVQSHRFWSWQMVKSPDGKQIASVTGQYLPGDYKYSPSSGTEPEVKVYDSVSGKLVCEFDHVPSVQAVAFSPDSKRVAAGNLMGEVKVFDIPKQKLVANWTTPDFTSWGIIKSHCYIGGIYDLEFSPDGESIYLAGMGQMRDPMAGNGRQLWQKFDWQSDPVKKIDETHKGESGEGLMESLAFHPDGKHFVMAGRLRGGAWNVGMFETETGKLIQSLKTGCRVAHAQFNRNGSLLYLLGGQGQPRNKDGKFPDFGRLDCYEVTLA